MLLYCGCQRTAQYPGVAKFGIALEWGSRGPEFESRHSDHKKILSIVRQDFFVMIHGSDGIAFIYKMGVYNSVRLTARVSLFYIYELFFFFCSMRLS